jgi:hypothetical protein
MVRILVGLENGDAADDASFSTPNRISAAEKG